ncbi:hypothetical protein CCR75_001561 [Bremia lactucae]|uniref:Tetraspanin n=1 Tax=Bremia lactucae TaxID=4779 RepID=A0A976IGD2_BRELC|nr:hypothetical protein CCR75_001561 [Bremia lactucae]
MRPTRKLLRLLTLLSFCCGVSLLGLALHVVISTTFGATAASLGFLGLCIVLLSVLGFVGAGREKSRLLLFFFFMNFALVTGLFVACYAAFFLQNALDTWVKHHWTAPVLAGLRQSSCCTTYSDAVVYLHKRSVAIGAIGMTCMLLILFSMYCVVRIVTVPIIMRNMLSVMNVALTLLGIALFLFGLSGKVHEEMTSGQTWIAIIFIIVGTLMVALSILGTIGARSKSRSMLFIYILGLATCLVALIVCAVSAFLFSDRLATTYNTHTSSSLACDIRLFGCTNCTDVAAEMLPCEGVRHTSSGSWISCNTSVSDDIINSHSDCIADMTVLHRQTHPSHDKSDLFTTKGRDLSIISWQIAQCGKCPEWSASDIQAYLQSTLDLLGLFALVVCLFMLVGCSSALILRQSLAGYQTDSL